MVALLVLLVVLTFLTADYFVQRRRLRRAPATEANASAVIDVHSRLPVASPRAPAGVFFAPGHTWAYLLPSGNVRVGLTDFARAVMGTVEEVEPRSRTDEVRKGDVLLRLRRGNHTATFQAPIEGTIERVNLGFLGPDATRPNEPYTSSWIYEIRPRDTSEIPKMMFLGDAARGWLRQEVERLRVFLATIVPPTRALGPTMPDGGLPSGDIVDSFSDADWQKFQERFFGGTLAQAVIAPRE